MGLLMCQCLSNCTVFCFEIGALHYVNHTLNRTLAIRLYAVPELITKSKCAVLIGVNMSKMLFALFMNHQHSLFI